MSEERLAEIRTRAEAAFIAAARTDVPELLAELDRLRAQVEELNADNDELRDKLSAVEVENDDLRAEIIDLEEGAR
ncbi:hypothetical protein [Streptomyces sp. NPDC088178]|uniref:hypothetical protein n=1 Tax=Streptomyces sp. NPDC088178 TaxID=3365836 RepID=UPI0037FA7720